MYPKIVYTLGPMCLYNGEYVKAKVYTIWAHGPLGNCKAPDPVNSKAQSRLENLNNCQQYYSLGVLLIVQGIYITALKP